MGGIHGARPCTHRRACARLGFTRLLGRSAFALLSVCAGAAAVAPAAFAGGSAQGPPAGPKSPPFTQCPAIGLDTSCEYLIDVTGANAAHPSVLQDPTQGFYDGEDDTAVGVQNDTGSPLAKLHIGVANSHDNLFAFDDDGLCSKLVAPKPAECPFSALLYDGPDTNLQAESPDAGTIYFRTPLQPGQYTYFTLEAAPAEELVAGDVNDTVSTTLSAETGEVGDSLDSPAPVAVTDVATIKGEQSAEATGTVEYVLYSDPACTKVVQALGSEPVVGGVAGASNPSDAKLPTNATYFWVAKYSGDISNSPNSSACGSETMTFGSPRTLPQPEVTTVLSGEGQMGNDITVMQGSTVTDTAIVTAPGGAPASGRLSYAVYTSATCVTEAAGAGGGGLTSGVGPATDALSLPPGTYYFRAFYSGSPQLHSASTPCGEEVLTVRAKPKPSTSVKGTVTHSATPAVQFYLLAYHLNHTNGQVTFTVKPSAPGTVTIDGVVEHGASLARVLSQPPAGKRKKTCRRGFVKIRGRCASDAPVLYGAVSLANSSPGTYTIVLRPTKRVLEALRHGNTPEVTLLVTFRSRSGAPAITRTGHEFVKLSRPQPKHRRS